jgi:NMD protein affecting ribosome stability and mRNA decay
LELPTEQAAKKVAREIAKQISIDVEDESLEDVVVKTEDGKKIYKAPIKSE